MKCKSCKNVIPDGSIYCNWCGERQVKKKEKKEISVPKPRQLPAGSWFAQLMIDGQRVSISAPTEKEYYAKARAVKAGLIEAKKDKKITLKEVCNNYIDKRDGTKSPSTIRGYKAIVKGRFQAYMDLDAHTIDYAQMVNDECKLEAKKGKKYSAKTIKNAWGFVKSALAEAGISTPKVSPPQVVQEELPWLQPEQIPIFLEAIKGKSIEFPALLALHGLRRSELCAITPNHIKDGWINVGGAVVYNADGELVHKDTNKNTSSRRPVKIQIPRLQELIDDSECAPNEPYVKLHISSIYKLINRECERAGLPKVGVHGLRRSFASLAYSLGWSELTTMEQGGWSDRATMNKKYVKLAQSAREKQVASMGDFYAKITNGITNEVPEPLQ